MSSLNVEINWEKSTYMIFKSDLCLEDLIVDNLKIKQVTVIDILGLKIHSRLSWEPTISALKNKVKGLLILRQTSQTLFDNGIHLMVYNAFIQSALSYCTATWGNWELNPTTSKII